MAANENEPMTSTFLDSLVTERMQYTPCRVLDAGVSAVSL